MWFERMTLERWFDAHQYEIEYDVGESAVKYQTVADLDLDLGEVALRYGHHTGDPRLKECLAAEYPGLSPDQVVVTSGASEAIFALNAALLKPGDHVVVEHPNYPSLYEIPRSLGCEVTFFSLTFPDAFKPDLDRLEELITPATRLISLTHPNNPTGSVLSEEELRRAVALAEERNVHLLFDETYRELDFSGRLPPAATLSPKVVSVSTMSKCYGLPGIRVGWLATRDQSILDSVLAVREQITIANSALGEAIALHVLERKDAFLARSRDHLLRNYATASGWMEAQEHLEWIEPAAGVVGFPRLRDHVEIDPEALYRGLVEMHRTFVVPGRCFEMDNRHFRLGFGGTHAELERGLENIRAAVAESA